MFKQKILDNQEKIKNISLIERDINFDSEILGLNKIISFVGPRRAGKTYFMYQVAKNLINEGKISYEEIVFLDFSEILQKKIDFDKILENFLEIYPNKKPFFIFDEIQNVENFREGIIGLFNKGFKIFISGSNAKLLSQEISTEFRGRNFEIFILPLSFKEFIKFKNLEFFETIKEKNFYSTQENALIKNLFLEFLKYGAYPEIALIDNVQIKEGIIKDYFNLLVYKDLKERYKIDNDFALKYLVSEISKNTGEEFSINKVFTSLKSQGIKIGKDTLYNYLIYLENIFFSKRILNFYSPKGASKNYLFDLSFGNIFSMGNSSDNNKENFEKKFENAIFLEFLRKNFSNLSDNPIYFKKILTREIAFFDELNNCDILVNFKFEKESQNTKKIIKNLDKSEEINKKIIFFETNYQNFSDYFSEDEQKNLIDFKKFFLK